MTIYEDYLKEKETLKAKHQREEAELFNMLLEKQKECKHKWERKEQLFYALGETAPGEECTECGRKRKIQPPPPKSWWPF